MALQIVVVTKSIIKVKEQERWPRTIILKI